MCEYNDGNKLLNYYYYYYLLVGGGEKHPISTRFWYLQEHFRGPSWKSQDQCAVLGVTECLTPVCLLLYNISKAAPN